MQDFVVMPNAEMLRGEVSRTLGGHSDVLVSHPTFWSQGRTAGQPLVENDPKYGKIYHLGNTADMMEMAHRENMLVYIPHPRSKGSAGFPDGIKDTAHFLDANYRGIGFRWGMGLDGSEQRLCEYRCLPLLDDMNNWVADKPTPPKYIQAISEVYEQGYGDDIYANNPVNYVKIDTLPPPGEWGPIVNAMEHGEYFVTSGEVLIPSYSVRRDRQPSQHRGGRAMDVSAGVRGGGLGRRAAHGSADDLRHRPRRLSEATAFRFRFRRKARSGYGSQRGIRPEMARWCSPLSLRGLPLPRVRPGSRT